MTSHDGYCARCDETPKGNVCSACGLLVIDYDRIGAIVTANIIASRLNTLAANLRVAAGLCRAFEAGRRSRGIARRGGRPSWRPGCQRPIDGGKGEK